MAKRSSHLQLRGGVYWFRLRVPDKLRPLVGKLEVTKSLRTGDLREAQQAARLERVKLDAEWTALRKRLDPSPATTLSEVEIWRLVSRRFVATERRSGGEPSDGISLDDALGEVSQVSNWDEMSGSLHVEARTALAEEGIKLDEASPAFLKLQQVLHRAWQEHARRWVHRHYPHAGMSLDPTFAELNERTILQPVAIWTLSKVMDELSNDPSRTRLTSKSALKRDAQWRLIKEFFGADTEIDRIDRRRIRGFMDLLKRLPSNASKHFPDATIFEAVGLGETKKLPTLSADTANGYLRQVGSIFRYAVNEGIVKSDPSSGLLLPKDGVRSKDKRLPFSTNDLRAIFAAPLYTGAVDDGFGYSKPGPNVVRRGRFWVPLIALFSGMRLNEICQLTLDDFVHEDGVDIILIRGEEDDETKRVKTEAGHRFVPVHPELRRVGLLSYVEKRRRRDRPTALLFPDLPLGSTGYRSDPFSKFFARFLDHVGVSHPKKVFHSFRHNYRDALREADISVERVRALGGWTSGRTEDDYGSGLKAATLARDIEKITYVDLDLKHLHQSPDAVCKGQDR